VTPRIAFRSITLVLLPVLLATCTEPPKNVGRPLVVVSIFPIADLTARIGGDAVRVETLLPPRASPATWEATPSQIRALAHASGYVRVGGGLDGWLNGVEPAGGDFRRLVLTDGLTLMHAADGPEARASGNPHVWLDPVLVRDQLLPRLRDFLASLVPSQADSVRARASAVADSLTALDADIRAELGRAPRRRFIATHDAWAYFAARYGLTSVGNVYERPGDEPSAQSLARLIDEARRAGVTTILAEPQLAETAAEAVAKELGVKVLVVDPLGGPNVQGRSSYFAMMRANARTFALALGAS
jgi:zinc transport system substrate-binding protein